MKRLVVATTNKGKMREIRELLKDTYDEILSLADLGIDVQIEEDGKTFAENAAKKALAVSRLVKGDVIADDSGLEVSALGGRPGVRSARYAGENADDAANNARLLAEMQGKEDRRARFVCCIVMANAGTVRFVAEGEVTGEIGTEPRGMAGFGYDPLFILPSSGLTFAETPAEDKNRLSHRARALAALREKIAGE